MASVLTWYRKMRNEKAKAPDPGREQSGYLGPPKRLVYPLSGRHEIWQVTRINYIPLYWCLRLNSIKDTSPSLAKPSVNNSSSDMNNRHDSTFERLKICLEDGLPPLSKQLSKIICQSAGRTADRRGDITALWYATILPCEHWRCIQWQVPSHREAWLRSVLNKLAMSWYAVCCSRSLENIAANVTQKPKLCRAESVYVATKISHCDRPRVQGLRASRENKIRPPRTIPNPRALWLLRASWPCWETPLPHPSANVHDSSWDDET